ncbi:hypothetical protein PUR28_40735 [Streptomyces sp. BE308]|uniref:hypothetical protein n=1 Tax=Streptomyces sp. BE308 TaxID=3002529 RepID=UPI002E78863B|nr:hypothetical protein [Streptomyces sp. BE308]MEE1797047.1 hypothetical protein [Streptomyces sp. BE308]
MRRPTEGRAVSGAHDTPAAPRAGGARDPRPEALVPATPATSATPATPATSATSAAPVTAFAEISEPPWGLPTSADRLGGAPTAEGPVVKGRAGEDLASEAPASDGAASEAPASEAPASDGAVSRGHRPRIARRGPADPVKPLMRSHRELCERAVDALEIAAGLEAHGLTDRTAARYRHRDVFSLAEELYARVPGSAGEPGARRAPGPGPDTGARAGWTLLALLPGAACLATAGVLRATEGLLGGGARCAVTALGALLVLLALRSCLRRGPLHAPQGSGRSALYGCWLLAYAVYGEELLAQVISGGPDGPWDGTPAPVLGLALAVAPAAWCVHLFSVHAHRKLAGSRALEEFGAGARPLLLGAVALFLCALVPLLLLADLGYGGGGTPVAVTALGVLFLLARLLCAHGFPEAATTGLAAACAVEAAAPALILAGRLPGLDLLARPVNALVTWGGTGAVPALACGAAALGLLVHAAFALSRASAHARA